MQRVFVASCAGQAIQALGPVIRVLAAKSSPRILAHLVGTAAHVVPRRFRSALMLVAGRRAMPCDICILATCSRRPHELVVEAASGAARLVGRQLVGRAHPRARTRARFVCRLPADKSGASSEGWRVTRAAHALVAGNCVVTPAQLCTRAHAAIAGRVPDEQKDGRYTKCVRETAAHRA